LLGPAQSLCTALAPHESTGETGVNVRHAAGLTCALHMRGRCFD
jgi:hypothetical protein